LTPTAATPVPTSRSDGLHRLWLSGDLEEQLLEVAGGPGERGDPEAGAHGVGQQPGRPVVVAVEPDLDLVVGQDLRGHHVRLAGEPGASRLVVVVVAEDPNPEHRADAEPLLDVRDLALGEHLAAVDDRDRRAQLLELREDVRGDEDRLAQAAELPEQLPQLDAGPRVEAGRRLVQQQHQRVVDQRVRQAQALLHAAREALDVRVALRPEVHQVQEVADHPPPALGGNAVAAGEEVQVLPDLHVVVDPEAVRHEPEDATHVVGVPANRRARDLGVAPVRDQERGEDPQRRRLAGAVRPHEPEDLALGDVQVQPAHGERLVVALDQARGRDDPAHSTVPSRRTRNWK
jgi:hypothetical protein